MIQGRYLISTVFTDFERKTKDNIKKDFFVES